ncbi:hypothetical protein NECAME_06167 [Necator americanus]|uniref:Uncharacterized protein n=1 Tax=Necator americanus TaxID=51031 RepID=W2TY25_NECAM|nr:hypothetical protein NECAME_06167 [Necator americanus]ETN85922.1 hypothetical protein NECAME_06167 [Necator americanus]
MLNPRIVEVIGASDTSELFSLDGICLIERKSYADPYHNYCLMEISSKPLKTTKTWECTDFRRRTSEDACGREQVRELCSMYAASQRRLVAFERSLQKAVARIRKEMSIESIAR